MLLTMIVVGAPPGDQTKVKSALLTLKDGRLQLNGTGTTHQLTEQEAADLTRSYLEDFLLRTHPKEKI